MNRISTDYEMITGINNESSNLHGYINCILWLRNEHYLFYSYPSHLIILLLFVRHSSINLEINYNLKHSG